MVFCNVSDKFFSFDFRCKKIWISGPLLSYFGSKKFSCYIFGPFLPNLNFLDQVGQSIFGPNIFTRDALWSRQIGEKLSLTSPKSCPTQAMKQSLFGVLVQVDDPRARSTSPKKKNSRKQKLLLKRTFFFHSTPFVILFLMKQLDVNAINFLRFSCFENMSKNLL